MGLFEWFAPKVKVEPEPEPEYFITGMKEHGTRSYLIEYGNADKRFMSVIYTTHMNGTIRPTPRVGDRVARRFIHSSTMSIIPPYFLLTINGYGFKHYPPISVEGIV